MAGDEFSLENGRKINKSQINGEILKSKLSQNDKYQKIFSLFDFNNDGKLDEKEVESFFEKMKSFASKVKSSVFESGEAEDFLKEFKDAKGDFDHMEDEMGDILFAVVNLARWNKIDAEQALLRANKKFMTRFRKMEELAQKPLSEYNFDEYDQLWKQAKKALDK